MQNVKLRDALIFIAVGAGDRAFFESKVNMAKSRHKKIVVEGIETAEQVAIIRECGYYSMICILYYYI